MKKFATLFLLSLMAGIFTSCDDNNNKGEAVETVSGFYTINGGNKSSKIPATLTAYDYATGSATDAEQDAFYAVNGIALGDGAQQAVVCNNKMYIAMYTSDLIWVVEPATLKIIKSIKPEGDATQPRYLAAKGDKVYCSMYTGYVSEIDTKTDEITRSVKVGPNPDGIAVSGNNLIVANTDGMNSKNNYANNSISVVDLSSFTQTEVKTPQFAGNHPTDAASNGTDAFVVMQGTYKDPSDPDYIPGIIVKVTGTGSADIKKVCDGTNIDVCGSNLLVIDAPYYGKPADRTYKVYDVNTFAEKGNIAKQVSGEESEILAPNGVFMDPVGGDIVMLSYYVDSTTGKSLTKEPCYANIYDKSGNFKKRIKCGVGARAVTFVHAVTEM